MALLGLALVVGWPGVKPILLGPQIYRVGLFCFHWIWTTIWSMALGSVIATFGEFELVRHPVLWQFPFQWIQVMAIPGAIWGLIAGLAQYGVLRRYYGRAAEWIVASAFGFCCGYLLMRLSPDRSFVGVVFGPLMGLPQLFVLRRRGWHAVGWLVASTVAWGLGWPVALGFFVTDTPTVTIIAMMGGLIGLVVGIVTGPTLAWILVDTESPRALQSQSPRNQDSDSDS